MYVVRGKVESIPDLIPELCFAFTSDWGLAWGFSGLKIRRPPSLNFALLDEEGIFQLGRFWKGRQPDPAVGLFVPLWVTGLIRGSYFY